MKKIFLSFILITITVIVYAQQITTKVDKRVELMSLVFRLAEAEEYLNAELPQYTQKIDSCFLPYKTHKLIKYTQFLRENYGVAYDAVMSLAVHLQIENGKVKLNLDLNKNQIDERWNQDILPKYINLLNNFYKKSKFEDFFTANSDFYKKTEQNFKTQITDNVNFTWFKNFFGTEMPHQLNLVASLLNGGGNYGANTESLNGKKEIFSIIGCWQTDSLGIPQYSTGVVSIVAHEFNHSFVDPLIDKFYLELQPQAEKFYSLVEKEMKALKYGSEKACLDEIFVRACEIKYDIAHRDTFQNWWQNVLLCNEKCSGFLWIDSLYSALTIYEENRDKYPALESFMPEIVKLQNKLNPNEIYQGIEDNKAEILGTNIENNSQEVDYSLDSIVLYFDRRMSRGFNGINDSYICNTCNEHVYTGKKPKWSADGKQWTVFVKLEPDSEYSFEFPNNYFKTPDQCYRPKNTYRLHFKTKPK
ncbi:MAG: DUF4932 domain-containing protein [Prevotellaceae bacterium]|jgi:hypothetical protein|nr:DUF4932 domain-containing protein [Prevotellaceae bacterium]